MGIVVVKWMGYCGVLFQYMTESDENVDDFGAMGVDCCASAGT